MQKNEKSYTFLLSQSSKSRVYIKRVSISKRYLHFGSVGLFFAIGMTSLAVGVSGIVRNTDFAEIASTAVTTQVAAQPAPAVPAQTETIDYSRPGPNEYAFNSGGPEEDTEADGENTELDNQLRVIQLNANPAFLPTMWAHLGKINNEFGFRRNPFGGRAYEFHPGMDIDGERGDLVVAPANGTIIAAGYKGGYGNMVEIDHGNGLTTRYGHMSKIEAATGDTISRGQLIGYVGSTGRSTGPHLHYELRLNDRPINPRHFLPTEPVDLSKIVKK
jgi:murein DD-endopeptidase MepM/ murein hydrolase activator NlpD